MAKDLNVAIVSGVVDSIPSVITTKNQKKICLFTLKVVERFVLATGKAAEHNNFLTIEVLGRNVDKCMANISQGDKCQVHGYVRVDFLNGAEKVRIRSYYIEKDCDAKE